MATMTNLSSIESVAYVASLKFLILFYCLLLNCRNTFAHFGKYFTHLYYVLGTMLLTGDTFKVFVIPLSCTKKSVYQIIYKKQSKNQEEILGPHLKCCIHIQRNDSISFLIKTHNHRAIVSICLFFFGSFSLVRASTFPGAS